MADRKHKVSTGKSPEATKDNPIFAYQISTDRLALMVLLGAFCMTQSELAAAKVSKVTEFVKQLNKLADKKKEYIDLEREAAKAQHVIYVLCAVAQAVSTIANTTVSEALSRSSSPDPALAASISLAKLLVNREEDEND